MLQYYIDFSGQIRTREDTVVQHERDRQCRRDREKRTEETVGKEVIHTMDMKETRKVNGAAINNVTN